MLNFFVTFAGIGLFVLIIHVVMPWLEGVRFRARERSLRSKREFKEYLMSRYHK